MQIGYLQDPDTNEQFYPVTSTAAIVNFDTDVNAIVEDQLVPIKTSVSGVTKFNVEVVTALPQTGETGTIYLVKSSTTANNLYTEYIWIENTASFEKLGEQVLDLTGYATQEWVESKGYLTQHQDISGKANKTATVSNVEYNSTTKKLTKTINGTTTDIVTIPSKTSELTNNSNFISGYISISEPKVFNQVYDKIGLNKDSGELTAVNLRTRALFEQFIAINTNGEYVSVDKLSTKLYFNKYGGTLLSVPDAINIERPAFTQWSKGIEPDSTVDLETQIPIFAFRKALIELTDTNDFVASDWFVEDSSIRNLTAVILPGGGINFTNIFPDMIFGPTEEWLAEHRIDVNGNNFINKSKYNLIVNVICVKEELYGKDTDKPRYIIKAELN